MAGGRKASGAQSMSASRSGAGSEPDPRRIGPSRSPMLERSLAPPVPETRDKREDRQHREPCAPRSTSGVCATVHPGRPPLTRRPAPGGRGVHAALHPGPRGSQSLERVPGPRHPQRKAVEECPPGAVSSSTAARTRVPPPRARSWLPGCRCARVAGVVTDGGFGIPRDRRARHSGLPQPAVRADEPHRSSGARHQRGRSAAASAVWPADVVWAMVTAWS